MAILVESILSLISDDLTIATQLLLLSYLLISLQSFPKATNGSYLDRTHFDFLTLSDFLSLTT